MFPKECFHDTFIVLHVLLPLAFPPSLPLRSHTVSFTRKNRLRQGILDNLTKHNSFLGFYNIHFSELLKKPSVFFIPVISKAYSNTNLFWGEHLHINDGHFGKWSPDGKLLEGRENFLVIFAHSQHITWC